MDREQAWLDAREYSPEKLRLAREILEEVRRGVAVERATRSHPLSEGGYVGKHALVYAYRQLTESGEWAFDPALLRRIRMKPARTLSGVTTVSVMTKPHPCPGECIFCPVDVRVPKSYLVDEPGAMRALHHDFDPFAQTAARIEALHAIGHPTDKIELIILGGTWSAYPQQYQGWFIQRCLDAMNGFDSESLEHAQSANEQAQHRNVGLVIETRPDWITPQEVRQLRGLGVTKVQIGAQSLDDKILWLNRRGHTVEQTRQAMALLRAAGFKVALHWMPNLLGATLVSDQEDFNRLWADPGLRPDEIKIYPCQLLQGAELYEVWERGEYRPYTTEELIALIVDLKGSIPSYCRVNRVVRDIPSHHVVEGNKRTSLRQDIQRELKRRGQRCACIRCREVRRSAVEVDELVLNSLVYRTRLSEEHFLSFVTRDDRLAAYLRLSLPSEAAPKCGLTAIDEAALVREVHVYGQSLALGAEEDGAAQHAGLGQDLMARAEQVAGEAGHARIAVIAALGTRGYYRRLGYELNQTYMVKELNLDI